MNYYLQLKTEQVKLTEATAKELIAKCYESITVLDDNEHQILFRLD